MKPAKVLTPVQQKKRDAAYAAARPATEADRQSAKMVKARELSKPATETDRVEASDE